MLPTGSRQNWFYDDTLALEQANLLSETIARTERQHPGVIPDLRAHPTLLIGSDYSGFHQAAQFEVISFLISNFECVSPWDTHRVHLRERFLPDQRRMSFKALNDGHRRAALMPFLNIANQIPGLLATIAIDRNISTIFKKETLDNDSERPAAYSLFEGWKTASIERAMRVIHFMSIFLRGLSAPGQDIWWFTDQDEIVANEHRLRSFVSLMANVSSHYLPHTLRHVRIGTTKSDTGRRDIEDFVAIADIAAGALQEVIGNGDARLLTDAPSFFLPQSESLNPKARRIMDWFADNTQPLRRLTFIVDEPVQGKPRITTLRFHGSRDADSLKVQLVRLG